MFTRVSDWFLLLAVVIGGGYALLALVEASGETIAYAAAFSMLLVPKIIGGAWATFTEGWREEVRMNRREARYGQSKGDSWRHGY